MVFLTRFIRIPRHPILAVLSVCALSILAGPAIPSQSVSAQSVSVTADRAHVQPAGFVYVNDNTVPNTVEGFARADNGSLTPLPGSPFSVGGSGFGTAGLGSQGGVELSSDGTLLFVVDAGSNQISVLHVNDNGSLNPVSGSPFASNGSAPVSIAVQGDVVFVANNGTATSVASDCNVITGGGSNYTGFRLGDSGRLRPLANSTYCVQPGAGLADVLISPDRRHVVGARVGTALSNSFLDSFDLDEGGELTVSPGSPFPAQISGPFGSAFRPTNSSQLFVSDAHGGTNAGAVSAYTVARNATLSTITGSPFADNQTAPCWLVITTDGSYVYTLNTASRTVSSYAIGSDGTLTLISSSLPTNGTAAPTDIGIDQSGHALYALEAGSPAVAGFKVQDGTVTEIAGSAFSLPSHPTHASGIAVK